MKQKIKQEIGGINTISITLLKKMATTKKLKNILYNYIENETIPSVRNAWVEYFLEIKKNSVK